MASRHRSDPFGPIHRRTGPTHFCDVFGIPQPPERSRGALPQARPLCLRGPGGPHRHDAGGGGPASTLARRPGIPRHGRRDQPHSGAELDRARDPSRTSPRRLERTLHGGRPLHRPRGADRPWHRHSVRRVRDHARLRMGALRHQAGGDRHHPQGPLGPREDGDEGFHDGGDRRRRPCRVPAGSQRIAASGRRGPRCHGREVRRADGERGRRSARPARVAAVSWRAPRRRRDVQHAHAVLELPEGRLRALRQRLRAARLPARRSRGAPGLAHRKPTARRHLRRPADPRSRYSPPPRSSATWSMAGKPRSSPPWPSSSRRSSSSPR